MEGATVTITAQQGSIDDNGTADSDKSKSHYGVSIAMGALTFSAEANEIDLDNTDDDYSGSGLGISYAVNDALSVAVHQGTRDQDGTVAEVFTDSCISNLHSCTWPVSQPDSNRYRRRHRFIKGI